MSRRISSLLASSLLFACPVDSGDGSPNGVADETSGSTSSMPSTGTDATTDMPGDASGAPDPGSTGDAGSTGADPACAGGCALVPDGWMGPVVAHHVGAGEEDPGCAGAFAQEVGRYDADFSAAPAACGCACGEMIGASCTVPYMAYNLNSCVQNSGSGLGVVAGCNNIPDIDDSGIIAFILRSPILTTAPCEPLPSVEVPEAGFGREVVLCGGELDDVGCAAGESCVPPQSEAVCIWAEGERTCPAAFPNAEVLYAGFEDTRACTACTCGEPDADAECTMDDATLHADSNACAMGIDGTVPPGTCVETTGIIRSIYVPEPQPPVGACPPSAVEAIGDAVPNPAVTLCCAG